MKRRLILLAILCLFLVLAACAQQNGTPENIDRPETPKTPDTSISQVSYPTPDMFPLAENCIGCHDNIKNADGSTYSYVEDWYQSIHAQSALDPLFLAVARAETMHLPEASELIQGVCAACHLPMADFTAQSTGASQAFLDNAARSNHELYALYKDGDSCMICHQLTSKDIPGYESYRGSQFSIDLGTPKAGDLRTIYSFYDLSDDGQTFMMKSMGYQSVQDEEIRSAKSNCSPCHTLYTDSFTVEGVPTGKQLPEQVTALEWDMSGFWNSSCQSCHMPLIVARDGALSNREVADAVKGGIREHSFLGANAFILRLLNDKFGALDQAIVQSRAYLETETARLKLSGKVEQGADGSDILALNVSIENLVGHKFPTGFPSRRAWLYVKVLDEAGNVIYESGAYNSKGMILDNDGDLKKGEFEPHYNVIDQPGQVQIYESVMIDSNGKATTNLLQGIYYGKDNRLIPRGFDKRTAHVDCAVVGDAMVDPDFVGGSDTVHYLIPIPAGSGKLTIEVEFLYQSVSYRFLENLKESPSAEQQILEELVEKNPNIPELVTKGELKINR